MSVREIPRLLATHPGRWMMWRGVVYRAWPVLRPLASAWRRGPVRRTRLVAVVGSYGKTTTARAVAAAVGSGREMGIASNQFGFLAARVLAIRPGQPRAVVEAGINGPGQMEAYAGMLRPDVAVVTSVGTEHRGSLGTLERTAEEKGAMVRSLTAEGTAGLNGDDPRVARMAEGCAGRVVTFGFGTGCDVRIVEAVPTWPWGTRLCLDVLGARLEVASRLVGRHMAYPVAAAFAVAAAEGVDSGEVVAGIEAMPPAPGRMQPVPLPGGGWLLRDDFKSGLETVDRALDVLAEIPARRKVVVLGDVSEPPGKQRPVYRRLGERVAEVADRGYFAGNRARALASGARAAGAPASSFRACGTRVRDAIDSLEGLPSAGDVILVKGRVTQRLERVALALMGRRVRCNIKICPAINLPCERCTMLERGWNEDRR